MNDTSGNNSSGIPDLTYRITIPFQKWDYYLVLSYFDEIKGPSFLFSYPELHPEKIDLSDHLSYLLDWFSTDSSYCILATDQVASYNMFFQIPLENSRGNSLTGMISLVLMRMPVSALGILLLAETPMRSLVEAVKTKLVKNRSETGVLSFEAVQPHIITAWETFQILFGMPSSPEAPEEGKVEKVSVPKDPFIPNNV